MLVVMMEVGVLGRVFGFGRGFLRGFGLLVIEVGVFSKAFRARRGLFGRLKLLVMMEVGAFGEVFGIVRKGWRGLGLLVYIEWSQTYGG